MMEILKLNNLVKVFHLFMCWIVVAPLSYIIPKDKKSVVFVGRFGNTFEGNQNIYISI